MLNCIRNGLWVASIFLLSGCWQKIEYTGEPVALTKSSPKSTSASFDNSPSSQVPERRSVVKPVPPTIDNSPAALQQVGVASESSSAAPTDTQPTTEFQPPTVSSIQSTPPVVARKPDDDDRYTLPAKAIETPADPRYVADDTQPSAVPEQQLPPRHTDAVPVSATVDIAVPKPTPKIKCAIWTLGSRLSLAALAHDRRMASNSIPIWLDEAQSACKVLGATTRQLPEPAPEGDASLASPQVIDYLLAEGQRIGRELSRQYGPEQAALFEVAMKSNLLLLLYSPGSEATDSILASIVRAAPQANLPRGLWSSLLNHIENRSSLEEVRSAVRQMHIDVSTYLASSEQVAR